MADPDVIVVGGGIVGCAIAAELAPDRDVLVLERETVASGATGKASGLLSPVYDHQANLPAARYATEFFERFDGTHHVSIDGSAGVFLFAAEERAHAEAAVADATEAGFEAGLYDADGLRERYPGTFGLERFAGGAVFEDVRWTDAYTLATALQTEAEAAGARFVTGTPVERVLADEAVSGVRTPHGDFEAPTVVVAAGWRTRPLLSGLLEVPVRPFRYQTAELEVEARLDDTVPIAWEHETLLYWRPTRDGSLHVGGQPYFVGSPGTTRHGATADFKRSIATAIPRYLPSIGEARLQSDDTCLTGDAATPDTLPILDAPLDAPDGLVLATGMHGLGIMLAPIAARTVRALVLDEDAPFPIEPYRLSRFEDRGTDFGSAYISSP